MPSRLRLLRDVGTPHHGVAATVLLLALTVALTLLADPSRAAAPSRSGAAAKTQTCTAWARPINKLSVRLCLERTITNGKRVYTTTAYLRSKRRNEALLVHDSRSQVDDSDASTSGGGVTVPPKTTISKVIGVVRIHDDKQKHQVTVTATVTSRNRQRVFIDATFDERM